MTKETEKAEMKASEDGKVELQEEQLDEAQGGILIGLNQTASNIVQKVNVADKPKLDGGTVLKF